MPRTALFIFLCLNFSNNVNGIIKQLTKPEITCAYLIWISRDVAIARTTRQAIQRSFN